MKIDIHTLAFILSLTNILQLLALSVLYRLNLSFNGIGFWITGTGLCSLGFLCNYLRDLEGIGLFAIIANNTLFVAGLLFIYIGVLRFFNQNEQRGWLIAICAVVTLAACYFTLIDDNQSVRRIFISLAISGVSLMIARALIMYRSRSVAVSVHFLCAVFCTGGIIFLLRGLTTFVVALQGNLFTPSLMQLLTYLTALVMSTLWTFGFIIMACQRSAFESLEAKEHFEEIFNTSPDAVLITRLNDGCIAAVNDAFTEMTGFTRSEVIGKSTVVVNLWKSLYDRQALVTALDEAGYCKNLEIVVQHKNGSCLTGIISAKVIEMQKTPYIISVARDISERKENENEMLRAKEALESALDSEQQMLEEQRHFLSMVSHEFRTPLAVIDSAATNLSAAPPHDQADLDQRAQQIMRATRTLVHLIENCITSERVEHGGFAIKLKETDVYHLIEEVAISASINAKDAITVDCSETPCIWPLDPTLIRIALSNLIDNAIKYSDDGKVTVRAQRNSGRLCIQVLNRGQNISLDEAEMMFHKFVRGKKNQYGRNVRGSGLGLFISRRIAQAHEGDITFRHENGNIVFEIRIPN